MNVGLLLGIKQGASRKNEIVDIYPNPASSNATLEYSLARGIGTASLVVRDLLGTQVMDIELRGSTGQVIFSVDNMINGVYFYS